MIDEKDKDLEYRVEHPETISSSNDYVISDDIKVKVKYVVEDLEYKEGGLYGTIRLIIKKKRKNESRYREIYSERLENKLFILSEEGYFNLSIRESRREKEIKKEYIDHFALGYDNKISGDQRKDIHLVPSMLEDTLDNLFSSIKRHYQRDTTGDIRTVA